MVVKQMTEKYVPMKIYFPESTLKVLKEMDNASAYVRRVVNNDLNSASTVQLQYSSLENREKELNIEMIDIQTKKKHLEHLLDVIEERKNYRPPDYEDAIKLLTEDVEYVTTDLLIGQAKRFNVSLDQFKLWLLDDGVYERINFA